MADAATELDRLRQPLSQHLVHTIDNEPFSRLLLDLYRAADDVSIGEFCRTALHRIQGQLPFDGAIWITSSTAGGRPRPSHHVWAIDGVPQDLVRHFGSDPDGSALFAFAREHLGEPQILNFADMVPGGLIATFTAHAGMHQVMTISEWNEALGAFTGLVLGRRDPRQCFNAEDRSWLRLLMPHLQALALRNVESQIRRTIVNRIAGNVGLAIVANDAVVLEQPNFAQWMRTMWPECSGRPLPKALVQTMRSGRPFVSCRGATIHLVYREDHTLLIATSPCDLQTLTRKEFAIASEFAQGKSYKEVARSHRLPPETVRSRLRSVYGKLSVSDKAELSRRFARTELLDQLQTLY